MRVLNLKPTTLLHVVGGVLSVAGLWFVFVRMSAELANLNSLAIYVGAWLPLILLSCVYGLANGLLAKAWWQLLRYLGCPVDFARAYRLFGLSQLAKYVPGNVFHLAGRQALGMSAGLPAGILAKSSLWELGLIVLAGLHFSLLALPLLFHTMTAVASVLWLVVVLALCALGLRRWFGKDVALALIWQLGFLVLSAAIFLVILAVVSAAPVSAVQWSAVMGSYVLAWLIGLLTPGAPAGVGVREAVLLHLLGHFLAPGDLVVAVVAGRIVTITGDLLFFFSANITRK